MIIPAYNEEENICKTIQEIELYKNECDFDLDYIVINDGSTDHTYDICLKNSIHCINLVQNLGIGGAVQTGYIYAKRKNYDIAVQFDGDGQHDIRSLKAILKPIWDGKANFTIGSRFIKKTDGFQSTFMRRVGIKWLSSLIYFLSGKRIYDVTSGYRAADYRAISLLAKEYPIDYPEPESIMYLLKNGLVITEVSANMFEREGGVSSIYSWKAVYYMLKVSLAVICAKLQRKVEI